MSNLTCAKLASCFFIINGLIQAIKRRARGFRNVEYLITMIYLHLGKLDLAVPAAF
jgi:hypothetical protein